MARLVGLALACQLVACGGDDPPKSDPDAEVVVALAIAEPDPGTRALSVSVSAVGILDPAVDVDVTDTGPGIVAAQGDPVAGSNSNDFNIVASGDPATVSYALSTATDATAEQSLDFRCLQGGGTTLSATATFTSAIDQVEVSGSSTVDVTCAGQFVEWPTNVVNSVLFLCPDGPDALLQVEPCNGAHILSFVKGPAGLHKIFGFDMDLASTSHGTLVSADEIDDVPESVDVTVTKTNGTVVVVELIDLGITVKSFTLP